MQLTINGQSQEFNQTQLSIAQLVVILQLQGKRLAIEHNGEIVPRSLFADTLLQAHDRVEIVSAVGGG